MESYSSKEQEKRRKLSNRLLAAITLKLRTTYAVKVHALT